MTTSTVPARKFASPDKVIEVVLRATGVELTDIQSKRRHPRLVMSRRLVEAALRRYTLMSYPEIGKMFGTTHTSAITRAKQWEKQKETDSVAGELWRWTCATIDRHIQERDGEAK